MNSLFAKCRHLVGSFHHNGDLLIRLRDHQKTLDFAEQTTLQSECKTRFSYLYNMVNSISINQSALERMFEEPDVNEKIPDYVLTATEFVLLNDLANLLLPMKQFIKILSSQKYPSLTCCSLCITI